MPLTRPIANPPVATPKGVQFFLADRSKIVHCVITRASLSKLAGDEVTIDRFEGTFQKHRERIESTASHKYDALVAFHSPFTITPADLTAYRNPIHLRQPT
jgi:Protein of unknown function (DUF1488)